MHNRILEAEINHLRKRNSELTEDISLKNNGGSNIGLECGKIAIDKEPFEMNERKSLISQLELETMKCQRLRRELELCNEEKQELISELKNNPRGECGSTKCNALFQENQLLSRQICRLEADKKLLIHSLAKYQESAFHGTTSGPFEEEPCNFSTRTPEHSSASDITEIPDCSPREDGEQLTKK
ncbi:hypothetical protein Aperf_G00000127539 [Anoplocephala perfoliata]